MSLSAEELGKRLLGEVEEAGLNEISAIIRNTYGRPVPALGISPIDDLATIFQPPSSAHYKHAVVEISSSGSTAGAAGLVDLALAVSVLPSPCQYGTSLGKGGLAIVLDTDGHFNVARLERVMMHYLDSKLASDEEWPTASKEKMVSCALQHVHVFRPQSMASLVATVQSLETYLLDSKNHHSSNRALSLVAISSISAFYWQDRAAEEAARFDTSSSDDKKQPPRVANTYWAALATSIRTLQARFEVPVLATSWGLIPQEQSRPGAPPSFRPYLPGAWQGLITLRLVTERDAVRKFAAGMQLDAALRESEMRMGVVKGGKWAAWVDLFGSEEWNDGTVQRLRQRGSRGFIYWVRDEGIDVDG